MPWFIIGLLLISLNVQAETAREALDRFLTNLDTLQAEFTQTVYDLESDRQGIASGVMQLRRPDRFRWDYLHPEERLILADGRDLWVVENDLEQITQYYQSTALKNTPASVLLAGESLEESFRATERGEHAGQKWLELTPRDAESDIEQVLLGFADNQLNILELSDKFGQVTQFHFSAMQRNPVISDEQFVFEPPEDWDVFAH